MTNRTRLSKRYLPSLILQAMVHLQWSTCCADLFVCWGQLEADEPKDDAGPPLKEHIRHLESRIHDLQEELEEEHDNYQQMEDAKDQMIKSLRSQLIETQNQMQVLTPLSITRSTSMH